MEVKAIGELPEAEELADDNLTIVDQESQEESTKVTFGEIRTYAQGDLPERIEAARKEAKEYTDKSIDDHDKSKTSHPDIRQAIEKEALDRAAAIKEHNESKIAHQDIRQDIRAGIEAEAQAREQQINEHNSSITSHANIREIINNHIGIPDWDKDNSILTFTAENGTKLVVNIPLESLSSGLDFDTETNEFVITKPDGTEKRIDVAELIAVYEGSIGEHIQITIEPGNVIKATLLVGSITEEMLSTALREKIETIENKLEELDETGGGGIEEAPVDGKIYGRKNRTWAEIVNGGSGDGSGDLGSWSFFIDRRLDSPTYGQLILRNPGGMLLVNGSSDNEALAAQINTIINNIINNGGSGLGSGDSAGLLEHIANITTAHGIDRIITNINEINTDYDVFKNKINDYMEQLSGLLNVNLTETQDKSSINVYIPNNELGKLAIDWQAFGRQNESASNFEVSRSTSPNGPWTSVTITTETSYIDSGLNEGVTYYYYVTAHCVSDVNSGIASCTTYSENLSAPTKPTLTLIRADSSSITIRREGGDRATSFEWYCNGTLFNSTSSLEVTKSGLLPSTSNKFYVKAINRAGVNASLFYDFETMSRTAKFVGVGGDNDAYYSLEGVEWIRTVIPSNTNWSSVAFGNGKFIAVADTPSNMAACSMDGINWEPLALPSIKNWAKILYLNGKFFILATDNSSIKSTDGINWTPSTVPGCSGMAYGNGIFVCHSLYQVFYSTDCINWIQAQVNNYYPTSAYFNSLVYGNGKFAINTNPRPGNSGCSIFYSEDGIVWTYATSNNASATDLVKMVNGNNRFLAVCRWNAQFILYSDNGVNWNIYQYADSNTFIKKLFFSYNKFIIAAGNWNGTIIGNFYSQDGINWIPFTFPTGITDICYGE